MKSIHQRYIKRLKRLEKRIKEGKYTNAFRLYQAKNSLYRMKLKNMPTKSEVIFKKYLIENKVVFMFQKGFLNPFHRIVDFYIPNGQIIIEIDGGYHKETVEKDANKDKIWGKMGYTTIRITNDEVNSGVFVNRWDVKSLTNKGLPGNEQTSV